MRSTTQISVICKKYLFLKGSNKKEKKIFISTHSDQVVANKRVVFQRDNSSNRTRSRKPSMQLKLDDHEKQVIEEVKDDAFRSLIHLTSVAEAD